MGNRVTGGVGGDILYFVSNLDKLGLSEKNGILKIFTKPSDKEPEEMKIHSALNNHNRLKHYIPKIFCKGLYKSEGDDVIKKGSYHYFIIENVYKSKVKYSGELYKVIRIICDKLSSSNNRIYKIFICNLLWQLLLILYTLTINGYTHCDIHPRNIFVKVVNKTNKNYPTIRLQPTGPMYAISIIDFGETSSNRKQCDQLRKKSKVLSEVGCDRWKKYTVSKKIGSSISALYHLPKWSRSKRKNTNFNSDIWFYFNLLKSMKLFPSKLLKKLNKFIKSADKSKGWNINSNNPMSSEHNFVKLLKIIISLFKSAIDNYENINILQLNKGNKGTKGTKGNKGKTSKYSLMDKKLLDSLR